MNPIFNRFIAEEELVEIESLGGTAVTIRKPTIKESNQFHKMSYTTVDLDSENQAKYTAKRVQDESMGLEIRIAKVCLCMLDPVITKEEINGLGDNAIDFIIEVSNAIDKIGKVDEEKKI